MAAKKKVPAKRAALKVPAVEGPFDEDGDLDEDGNVARATFDPTTHGIFLTAYVESLSAARGEETKAEAKAVSADAERLEAIFSGIGGRASDDRDHIKNLRTKLDDKDKGLDDYREKLAAKDREIAALLSSREEAALERDRLKHDIEMKELAIQHLQTLKGYELEVRKSELATLKEIGAPAAMIVAEGLGGFLQSKLPGFPGMAKSNGSPGGLPAPPTGAPHPPPRAAQGRVSADGATYTPAVISLEETEAWADAFLNVFRRQGPVGIAHLRASLLSLLPGTPTFPKSMRELLTIIYSEAGEEAFETLRHLTTHAYRPEPAPAQAGNGDSN